MKIAILMLCFTSIAVSHEVYESSEEIYPVFNITTLYPTNKTIEKIKNEVKVSHTTTETNKFNLKETKIQRDFQKEDKETEAIIDYEGDRDINISIEKDEPKQRCQENKGVENHRNKPHITSWSINTSYAQHKDDIEDLEKVDSKEVLAIDKPENKFESKEFKPSPHLGNFFDEENLPPMTYSTPKPYVLKEMKPTTDFKSSPKDLFMLNYKSPKDPYRDQLDASFKFENENSYFSKSIWEQPLLESKPTVEAPTKIPAGGLYKHSHPFKDKPGINGNDEDFGLAFNEDGKESSVKKRPNPWKKILNLVTAFLPIGIIISALTPNVVTIHSTSNDPHLNRFSRRSDSIPVPAVSENCKRRLLCEIHSEQNYMRSQDKPLGYPRKHCYKLRCEDPRALERVLRWLLAHRPRHRLA